MLRNISRKSFSLKLQAALSFLTIASVLSIGSFSRHNLQAEETKNQISWTSSQLSEHFFSEGVSAGDLNKDGHADLVYGPFWFEGPTWKKKHIIYNPKPFDPHGYADNFFIYVDDINGDDWDDVLVFGFPGQAAHWYENPQNRERPWDKHLATKVVDNESPTYVDLTGDGQREIVCSQAGTFGYATFDKKNPTAIWKFHPISGEKVTGGRFTHGMGAGDVNGDGRLDLLEKSGWWEQPADLAANKTWIKHPFAFSGPGGSQMYATDIDGDGDQDVVTSLAAHGYGLAWYEQIEGINFKQHLIMGASSTDNEYGIVFSQPHALSLVDIDGDGLKDIVTGKRHWAHGPHGDPEPNGNAVLYWFRCERYKDDKGNLQARFVPQLISSNQGVGVDVQIHDMNGDSIPDVIVGNKLGAFVHLQQRQKVSFAQWNKTQPIRRELTAKLDHKTYDDNDGKTPEEAARAMTVPKGFHVDLIAGEPNLHQPIAFCFDAKGRIWVAEAHTYPRRAPEGKGKDRIVVLEDTDGDGKYEKQTLFRDGLNLVSGLEVGFGGVWVGAAPYLMFIPDRNDDLVPDGPEQILLDGWGYQDTHETLNAFIWGPDGWLYGCHGVFTHSKIGKPGTPDDKRIPMNAGVWRYHPLKHQFEVFAWGTSNPWGVDFTDTGEAFLACCVIPHAFHIVPGARYHRQGGRHFSPYVYDDIKTIADHLHYAGGIGDHAWWGGRNEAAHDDATSQAGGGHAHCGAMIYRGDNWPTSYRNSLMMFNVHGNRINNDLLRPNGSTYIASHGPDALFANDPWFRGVNLKVGPDGAVYMIDWYDKNACHRRDPDVWDRTNGRLYRISYGEYSPRPVDLSKATTGKLIEQLAHENSWQVTMARKYLQHQFARLPDSDAQKQRVVLALKKKLNATQSVTTKLNFLWTIHAVSGIDQTETLALLENSEPMIRSWMVRLATESQTVSPEVLSRFVKMAGEERSLVVRRELASALQKLPEAQRWELGATLVAHHDSQYDKMIPLLIWYGVEPLVVQDTKRALTLAQNAHIPLVSNFIFRRTASSAETLPHLVEALKEMNRNLAKQAILELATAMKSLGKVKMPADWPGVAGKHSASQDAQVRAAVQAISVKFGDKSIFPQLRKILANTKNDITARKNAMNVLVQGKDQQVVPVLIASLDEPSIRSSAIKALSSFDSKEIPAAILSRIKSWKPNEQATAVATLCSRVDSAEILFNALKKGDIPRSYVTAVHITQLQQLGNKELLKKVETIWGSIRQTPAEKLKQIASLKKSLTAKQLAKADKSNGRVVYNKTCGQCHQFFGTGGKVGPDITGSNRKKLEYLLENMIDPNALVGKDYQAISIATMDGRVVTGLIKEENDSAVVLQTVEDVVTIPKSEIDERSQTSQSIMPEGQLKTLSENQIRDLIAYLQSDYQIPLPGQGPYFDVQKGIVPGAIEGESLKVVEVSGGATRTQAMGSFTKDRWSNKNHLWWTGGKPGSTLTLEFPVDKTGQYEILAVFTKAHDYGKVKLRIDDNEQETEFDLFNKKNVITTGVVSLGTLKLDAGKHRLHVEITGKHSDATPAYMFGIDYLYLSKPTVSTKK